MNPLVIPITIIQDDNEKISTHALVDSGATSNFIDSDFINKNELILEQKDTPTPLYVIDGRPVISGAVTHTCAITCNLGNTSTRLVLDVTRLGPSPVVLGMPWLRAKNPAIDWTRKIVILPEPESIPVRALPFIPSDERNDPVLHIDSCDAEAYASETMTAESFGKLWYQSEDPNTTLEICATSTSERGHAQPTFPDDLLDPSEYIDKLKAIVPDQYHSHLAAFSTQKADTLPPHRPYDLSIELEEGKQPPFGPLYSLSELELKALSEWLDENLSKGFIRASKSPAGAPILFVGWVLALVCRL